MFDGSDIFHFNNKNFNYIKERRYMDTQGNVDIHPSNRIVFATKNQMSNYKVEKSSFDTYIVYKDWVNLKVFDTEQKAIDYMYSMMNNDLKKYIKYSFKDLEEAEDYHHLFLGNNLFESKAIIMDAYGYLKTRTY